MTKNESSIDRAVRVALAVAAVVAAYLVGFGSIAGIVLLAVGAILAVTAATGFCPLYRVLGLNTCPVPQAKH